MKVRRGQGVQGVVYPFWESQGGGLAKVGAE
jgi:hypothetical protein